MSLILGIYCSCPVFFIGKHIHYKTLHVQGLKVSNKTGTFVTFHSGTGMHKLGIWYSFSPKVEGFGLEL